MQKFIWILWPSFLMAIVMDGVIFSLFDPMELDLFGIELAEHRLAAYTAGFFLFWTFGAACSGLTLFLQHSSADVNRFCPLPGDRPADTGTPKHPGP